MTVELRAALTAETVAWEAPEPTCSIVVKGTFQLTPVLSLITPRPLSDDETGPSGELHYPSDRIPRKGQPEVMIVGHARAAEPRNSIDVVLKVEGGVAKHCCARAGRPSRTIPLHPSYLRRDAQSFDSVRVGPALEVPVRWLQRRLTSNFDFSAFNAAPLDQRLPEITPSAALAIEGVTNDGTVLHTRLPAEAPRVFLRESRLAVPVPVPISCDTLWIDVDERIACMVWRAVLPQPRTSSSFVVLWSERSLEPHEIAAPAPPRREPRAPATTVDINERLVQQGARLPFASATNATPRADEEAQSGEPKSWTPSSERGLPSPAQGTPETPASAPEDEGAFLSETTVTLSEHTMGFAIRNAEHTLPFAGLATRAKAAPRKSPESDPSLPFKKATVPARFASVLASLGDNFDAGRTVGSPVAKATADALPFSEKKSASQARPPLPSSPATAESSPWSPSSESAPAQQTAWPPQTALPQQTARPPQTALPPQTAVPPQTALPPQSTPPLPYTPTAQLAGPLLATPTLQSAPLQQAAPPARRARLSISQIAAIKAALLDGADLSSTLAAKNIDEHAWRYSDRMLAIDLEREHADGGRALTLEFERAIAASRRPPRPVIEPSVDDEIDVYVNTRVELEEADDPARALDQLGLSQDEWTRMRRTWTRRMREEPELAATIRTLLRDTRRIYRQLRR